MEYVVYCKVQVPIYAYQLYYYSIQRLLLLILEIVLVDINCYKLHYGNPIPTQPFGN